MDIADIATTDYIELEAETNLGKARSIFEEENPKGIIVTRAGDYAGVLTQKQLLQSHIEDHTKVETLTKAAPKIERTDNIRDVARSLVEGGTKVAPVFESGELWGVIDEDLILEAVLENLDSLTVEQIYTKSPITVDDDATLGQVINRLREHAISRLPVVDDDGYLTGVVTTHDVVDFATRNEQRITGKGDRAFSAGADVTAMAGGADPLEAIELSRKGQRTFGKLEEVDLPVVAGIDGFALGGGFELALCCDLRIASERSELGTPEHNLGLLPGWGGTQRLMRVTGFGRAKEIVFTAERYDPETMYDYGVVNEVVPTDEFEARAHELAAELAAGPPISQKLTKRAMIRGYGDVEAGLELEAQAFGHLIATDDLMEGITAFMGDGEPEFEGT